MNSKAGRRFFTFMGCLFLLYTGILSSASIYSLGFLQGHELIQLSLSIMCFCLAYLYPQFKKNDERTKVIKERGMFFSYFFFAAYSLMLMLMFQFGLLSLSGYQTVTLMASLMIITVFSSFVILSKRY
ncbi:hypothetical protein [Oceanobacillus sp. ISL-74]|uniref:hypothetical protein n=1 Tax=Oceanobacillus sp. ISL-74 TaxID=2819162 RepID=UPI002035BCFE|nr:hypothetical protein [Oceanobacillus sp. ISL-74]